MCEALGSIFSTGKEEEEEEEEKKTKITKPQSVS
jgi:hypothetical protein